jgi:hypothetical protein
VGIHALTFDGPMLPSAALVRGDPQGVAWLTSDPIEPVR